MEVEYDWPFHLNSSRSNLAMDPQNCAKRHQYQCFRHGEQRHGWLCRKQSRQTSPTCKFMGSIAVTSPHLVLWNRFKRPLVGSPKECPGWTSQAGALPQQPRPCCSALPSTSKTKHKHFCVTTFYKKQGQSKFYRAAVEVSMPIISE